MHETQHKHDRGARATRPSNAGPLLLAAALFAARAGASVFYVDAVHGDNGNAGTYAAPLATITYALEQVGVTEVRVLPGTYDTDTETFPLQPGNVTLAGYENETTPATDPADHIITGAGATPAAALFAYGSGDAAMLANLTLTGATGGAIHVTNAELDIVNCIPRNLTGSTASGVQIDGASAVVTASNSLFKANSGHTVRIASGAASFTAYDSTWLNNTNASVRADRGTGGTLAFYDCLFDANHSSVNLNGSVVWNDSTGIAVIDRCQFLRHTGTAIIGSGTDKTGATEGRTHIHNSLFADNVLTRAIIDGRREEVACRNVTFANNTIPNGLYWDDRLGSLTLYNAIVAGNTILNNSSWAGRKENLRIYDTVIWDTPLGYEYSETLSGNVMAFDPEFVDAGGGDYRLTPWSEAIDAGNNANVLGANDLDGAPRVLDGTDDASAVVDLGAYESTFYDPPSPTFQPDQPLYAMFGGTSISFDAAVVPVIGDTVTGQIVIDAAFQTDPATFTDGAPASFTLTAADVVYGATGTLYGATMEETVTTVGVGERFFGVRIHDRRVTHGKPDRVFIKSGATLDVPVTLINPSIRGGSPATITMTTDVTGSGTHTIAWTGGDRIAPAAAATTGHLSITGVAGTLTVTLSLSVGGDDPSFAFAESGTTSASFDVIAFESPVYVSASGSDATGDGSLSSPLRSLTYALSVVDQDDEIRLLPGTYTAATETFPFSPGTATIAGEGDAEAIVIDADGEPVIFDYGAGDTGSVRNVTLTGATGGAINARDCELTVDGVRFVNMIPSLDIYPCGIRIFDGADVVATHVLFTGNSTRPTVDIIAGNGSFRAYDSTWTQNTNAPARSSSATGTLEFHGCHFVANHTTGPREGSAIQNNSATAALIDRCVFTNNTGSCIIGRNQDPVRSYNIHNSLFADNTLTSALFSGRRIAVTCRNATFVNNTVPDGLHYRSVADGVFTVYNAVIAGNSVLNNSNKDSYRLYDTVIWDTPEGLGYHDTLNANVMAFDPEFVDADGGDYRLESWSAAVDAGNNTHVLRDRDLDNHPRILDGTGDDVQVVDLGAYESTFYEPQTSSFVLGASQYAMFGGTGIEVAGQILPVTTATVEAAFSSPGPLQADSIVFTDGQDTTFTIQADDGTYGATGVLYSATLTETTSPSTGVEPLSFGVRAYDRLVTHGAPARLFIKNGDSLERPVALISSAIHNGAPAELTIGLSVSGSGSHAITWEGANVIRQGTVATAGALHITGGSGVRTVTLSVSTAAGPAFAFSESGSSSAAFEVIEVDIPTIVSGAGSDETGVGSYANPFRSMTYALGFLDDGDEIRLLSGTYAAATESFPLSPGAVAIVGEGDATDIVIDAAGEGTVFAYDAGVTGSVRNVTLTGATAGAIRVDDAGLNVSGVRFMNMTPALDIHASGIRIVGDSSHVVVTNALFQGNNTRATVDIAAGSGTFQAYHSTWTLNTNAPVRSESTSGTLELYDCLFTANHGTTTRTGSAVFNQGTEALIERCRFTLNTGHCVIGSPIDSLKSHGIQNSLFADNVLSGALVQGRRIGATARNLTLVNNTVPAGVFYREVAGTFTFYNSIIAGNDVLNNSSTSYTPKDAFRLYDTVLWDTPEGHGYHDTLSENVTEFDPDFRNAMDGDYRPRHVSAALDAGNNDSVAGEWDLDGNPRIVDHNRDKQAIVDLGAYEIPTPRRGILMIAR